MISNILNSSRKRFSLIALFIILTIAFFIVIFLFGTKSIVYGNNLSDGMNPSDGITPSDGNNPSEPSDQHIVEVLVEPGVQNIDLIELTGTSLVVTSSESNKITIETIPMNNAQNQGFFIEDAIKFVDLKVDSHTGIDEIIFTIHNAAGVPKWWDGNMWINCSNYQIEGNNTIIIINNNTIPSFQDLTGTVFAIMKEIPVLIDIKPDDGNNVINLKAEGVIPVALITSLNFNALDVNTNTIKFANAPLIKWQKEDVNNDGKLDAIFYFKIQELNLNINSQNAELIGESSEAKPIKGIDSVKIIKDKK